MDHNFVFDHESVFDQESNTLLKNKRVENKLVLMNNLPFKHSIIFGNSPRNERILSVVSPGVGLGNTLVSKLYF